MSYTDHPPVITAAHVKTANKFIDFTLKSSLTRIVYAIPPDTWADAKERVIQTLKDHGCEKYGEGMTKSSVEKAMRTYHFGEKWKDLFNEMVDDCLIECGDPAPTGGCKIYLYGNAPRPAKT